MNVHDIKVLNGDDLGIISGIQITDCWVLRF